MPTIIDGSKISSDLKEAIKAKIEKAKVKHNKVPHLVVIIVGENPASQVYVRNKEKGCEFVGIRSTKYEFPENVSQEELLAKIDQLNNDKEVNGILVQLPLPKHIDENAVIKAISCEKDVDGFHLMNVGKLSTGQINCCDGGGIIPCTPRGCLHLIKSVLGDNLAGKKAVVLGRSNIVGKPIANLLLNESCTVKIVHSKTENLAEECKWADILVAAVGKPKMVKANMVKPGAVVIDVGINRIQNDEGKNILVGDVDFEDVKDAAGAITPVPGGVGPMTIAYLLQNTYDAFLMQNGWMAD
jgi:methylenetetrahydrofolate dehydrogenase (NADP+)/methenyltetrahydrofolate cyclohydrolase